MMLAVLSIQVPVNYLRMISHWAWRAATWWPTKWVFAVFFMLMMLSSIGMPAIPGNGFVGELTILLGAFALPQKYWAVLAASGIVLGAVYMLWLYQLTIGGKLYRE